MKIFAHKQRETKVWFFSIPWRSERDDRIDEFIHECTMDTIPRIGDAVSFGWFSGTVLRVLWEFSKKENTHCIHIYVKPDLDYKQTPVPHPIERWKGYR